MSKLFYTMYGDLRSATDETLRSWYAEIEEELVRPTLRTVGWTDRVGKLAARQHAIADEAAKRRVRNGSGHTGYTVIDGSGQAWTQLPLL